MQFCADLVPTRAIFFVRKFCQITDTFTQLSLSHFRLSILLVLSDVALLSYTSGYARIHLITAAEQMKQGIVGVLGGSSVLRLALWWWGGRRRQRVVQQKRAKEEDGGTSEQQSMPFSFGALSIGRHDKRMSRLLQLLQQ